MAVRKWVIVLIRAQRYYFFLNCARVCEIFDFKINGIIYYIYYKVGQVAILSRYGFGVNRRKNAKNNKKSLKYTKKFANMKILL